MFNFSQRLLAIFAIQALATSFPTRAADQPESKTLAADLKRVDALMRVFTETQKRGDQFGDKFWRASKRLGDETGPRIIQAVVVRCRSYHDETPLIFVPLVALLDRKSTLTILHQYEHSDVEADRIWAHEFLIEFEVSDTQEGVAKYSKPLPKDPVKSQ